MIQSPCHIMTGIPFRMPHTSMGQYMQGQVGGLNNTEEERTVDPFYIKLAGNVSGHCLFKLDTKQPISVKRITIVPMSKVFMERINRMSKEDSTPDGIQIRDAKDKFTILDFLTEAGNDYSNASDESFKHYELYQKEFDDQLKEESLFMKIMASDYWSDGRLKTQGEYTTHKEQGDHFFRKPQNKSDDSNYEHSEADSNYHDAHNNNGIESVQSTRSDNGRNAEVPEILQS